MKRAVFSVDVEDWFQVENLRSKFPLEVWDNQELRIEKSTEIVLGILEEFGVKATFFVLGWVAERLPNLVKRISESGHEVASHGFNHVLNHLLSSQELRDDLERSKKLLEDISGQMVMGYRAPSFTLTKELIRLLPELGYRYDSSLNNFFLHDRYIKMDIENRSESNYFVFENGLVEFPMPLVKFWGRPLFPISGGGYIRIFPFEVFKMLVDKFLADNDLYVFYMHPWEVDYRQPRVKGIRFSFKLRHYSGLKGMSSRIRGLIRHLKSRGVRFVRFRDLIHEMDEGSPLLTP